MKKIFTTFVMALCVAGMLRAEMVLVVDGEEVNTEATITVTEYEEDELTGEVEMGWSGSIKGYLGSLSVDIQRTAGVDDELCIGQECKAGNGEAQETKTYTLATVPGQTSNPRVYAHYYPTAPGQETIVYTFRGDRTITLTVVYAYTAASLNTLTQQGKSVKVIRDGQIYIRRNGVEYTILGSKK